MRLLTCLFYTMVLIVNLTAQSIPFDNNKNQTVTYRECIDFYKNVASQSDMVQMVELGPTDSGFPLHLVIVSKDKQFDPDTIKRAGKSILWINNGIHPGEPEGIDASMMLVRDILKSEEKQALLDNVVLAIVPIYNIGGSLNRNSFSRANQNGPESYGFRGNAKNLDLNRDFIKCDSRNAQTMVKALSAWDPDVFVDTHTSNGADYPYTVTLIETQKDKIEAPLKDYVTGTMTPDLYKEMKKRNWEMVPYVNVDGTPDNGIEGFLESPRYSTGFTTQHHIIGYTLETHMWKPFEDRVWASYHFLDAVLGLNHRDADLIMKSREKAKMAAKNKAEFPIRWEIDKSKEEIISFKGYEAKYKKSKVSGLERLYYDRDKPYEKNIPYWNTFVPAELVKKPVAYLVPQAYQGVISRLRWNGVEIKELSDTLSLESHFYKIEDYETTNFPYESHYMHYNVKVEKTLKKKKWQKGDYVVFANQENNRIVMENLEPQATDSYFAWNFFDGILMQKEYFSSYVFEETAAAFLKDHPEIKKELDAKRNADPKIAENARAQLDFIYKRSPWYEPTHMLYPISRLETFEKLPIR
ncbi:MAG: M14 family zinc carboxypeptidase [Saprospiraceae bacterium]